MHARNLIFAAILSLAAHTGCVLADEAQPASSDSPSLFKQYTAKAQAATQAALNQALDMLGIRYRRGGTSPENGFDCSGFVGHVFREGIGLILPRSAAEISKTGETVNKDELKPGDLVFFNTMRRAFSHVGIYLGNNQFIHAPRVGGQIRIEDMRESYWAKRYNGARRVAEDGNQQ
ncbi:MAG: glycoside hydrolase [Rhodocyclaceae bacterium]|nr:MAG: glycoside hydrolase [Rhodocyclaceae bacterium]